MRIRAQIWSSTVAAIVVYTACIWAADRFVMQRLIAFRPLALALAFTSIQLAAIFIFLATVFARKRRNVLRERRTSRLAAEIDEALAEHSLGIDRHERLAGLQRESRYDVRERVRSFLSTLTGEPRERLEVLAERLGIEGTSGSSQIEEARVLIRSGEPDALDRAIRIASESTLLVRAVIVEELERFAANVSDDQLLHALQSDDRRLVITALDMLQAWRRNVRVSGFTLLLAHGDPAVRERALHALPYISAGQGESAIADVIVAGLGHSNAAIREASARAAGKMKIARAVGPLGSALSDSIAEVSVAAAFALAEIGPAGMAALQGMIISPDRRAAAFAFEALEKSAIGRLETA